MKKLIRNSTAEFLIFTSQGGDYSVEARVGDETVWLTKKLLAELFSVNELKDDLVIRKFRITTAVGKKYLTQFYNQAETRRQRVKF